MEERTTATNPIHTVGHSNLSLGEFLNTLRQRGIQRVVDVRSVPYSRHVPHFNRDNIRRALEQWNIAYTHMEQLGGRPGEDRLYNADRRADYALMAQEPTFLEGIGQVEEMARSEMVALMCTEAEPLQCHRALLAAHELDRRGMEVRHLLRNGRSETHDDMVGKLLVAQHLLQEAWPGATRQQLADEAVRRQAGKAAHRRPAGSEGRQAEASG